MFVRMGADIMPVLFQDCNELRKRSLAEKITGEKERSFNVPAFQLPVNEFSAISKFMTGKNQRDLFLRAVAPGDRATIPAQAPAQGGGYRFFGRLSASFAASR